MGKLVRGVLGAPFLFPAYRKNEVRVGNRRGAKIVKEMVFG